MARSCKSSVPVHIPSMPATCWLSCCSCACWRKPASRASTCSGVSDVVTSAVGCCSSSGAWTTSIMWGRTGTATVNSSAIPYPSGAKPGSSGNKGSITAPGRAGKVPPPPDSRRDDLRHHLAVGDERHGPARPVGQRHLRVDAEQVVGGRQDVLGGDRPFGDAAGDLVRP